MNTHSYGAVALTLASGMALSQPTHADVLSSPTSARSAQAAGSAGNAFNPAISLILDGRYTVTDLEDLKFSGFQANGAEAPGDGFGLGETEFAISANVDDKVLGWLTLALEDDDGETEVELEEAYIETIGLGHGLTLRGGRFYSHLGYENAVHDHALDFTDRSLVYSAMFGSNFIGDGIQARWIAPTDVFLEFGAEVSSGKNFPGGDNDNNIGSSIAFVRTGGDFGVSHAWRLGASYFSADFDERSDSSEDFPDQAFTIVDGSSDVVGIDLVYKWAPSGNSQQRNLKIVAEYLVRREDGLALFDANGEQASARYDGKQDGYYIQSMYQWRPNWRAGLRYDRLSSDNRLNGFDADVDGNASNVALADFTDRSGLFGDMDPERWTASVDYSPSEFSRFRLQYSDTDTGNFSDEAVILQYIVSLGSHPAHSF